MGTPQAIRCCGIKSLVMARNETVAICSCIPLLINIHIQPYITTTLCPCILIPCKWFLIWDFASKRGTVVNVNRDFIMYKFCIVVITWLVLHSKVFTDMYWILWNRNKNTIQYNTLPHQTPLIYITFLTRHKYKRQAKWVKFLLSSYADLLAVSYVLLAFLWKITVQTLKVPYSNYASSVSICTRHTLHSSYQHQYQQLAQTTTL